MKTQIVSIESAITTPAGQAIPASTVAHLEQMSCDMDSAMVVVSINSNRGTTQSSPLMIDPAEWAATVQGDMENEDYPNQDDVESIDAVSCTDDGTRSVLAVELLDFEWEFNFAAKIATRYACPVCEHWCDSEESAKECCE